ncbi:MAG: hypothetical protein EPO30_04690 [Lysobacteraceae bacterium]|nr:MAG: hypothetical protein EPO30_04690 [Xanthomonadaceae bacterium]
MREDCRKELELREDRERVASYIVGFLRAFQAAALPHQSLIGKEASPELVSCALAHLQVFAVRALETFFRDCFVVLCKRDSTFLEKATEATKGKIDYATLSKFISGKSSLEEHLAAERNFQNLDVVNMAFAPLFGRPTFEALNKTTFNPVLPGAPARSSPICLDGKPWRALLYELVASRHQIIHNANHPLPQDQVHVVEQANMVLLVGQLFGLHLAQTLGVGTLVTEAPLWMVVLMAVAAKSEESPEVLLGRMAKQVELNPELKEAKGHIGPVLLPAQHVMRLRFVEDRSTAHSISADQEIIHLVTKVGDNYELSTVVSAEALSQDGGKGEL